MEGSVESTDVKVDGLGDRGNMCRLPEAKEILSFSKVSKSRLALRFMHPPMQSAPGTFLLRVKRPERERNQSPQFK